MKVYSAELSELSQIRSDPPSFNAYRLQLKVLVCLIKIGIPVGLIALHPICGLPSDPAKGKCCIDDPVALGASTELHAPKDRPSILSGKRRSNRCQQPLRRSAEGAKAEGVPRVTHSPPPA